MTWAERWQEEGRQKGRQEGRQEGQKEGQKEGRVGTLKKLLELRFGPLDQAALAALESASDEALARITERVLTAATLRAALGE